MAIDLTLVNKNAIIRKNEDQRFPINNEIRILVWVFREEQGFFKKLKINQYVAIPNP